MLIRVCALVFLLILSLAGTSPAALVDNGDGTVTDTVSGLQWQQNSMDLDSDGTPDIMTWQQALAACQNINNLGGYSDWRLPNILELRSIVDYSRYSPAIDITLFPDTVSSYYWSSTTPAIPTTRGTCTSASATTSSTISRAVFMCARFAADSVGHFSLGPCFCPP